ncbi:hypothetical protein OEZ86_012287 [Tetradesmus obliquus]|nr:hypothetical protein OEZ86_012287 [Tetradesmus obliquus]
MSQLVQLAVGQMQLLHAVDTFPRGGLCQGGALKEALRRYERLWLPLIAAQAGPGSATANGQQQQQQGYSALVPPLDVAFLWHLHRLQPGLYVEDCCQLKGRDGKSLQRALAVTGQQAFAFSDGNDTAGAATAALWRKAYPNEPFWPPAAPGSQTAAFRSRLAADLAAVAVRVPVFTHQLLRACYVQLPFLSRAVDRYAKFLLLRKHHLELQHPIPPLDVALMWSAHMSVGGEYARDMLQLLQRPFADMPGAGASPWLERDASGPWRFHWADTQRAWLEEFEEPFVVPGSGYVPMDSPHTAELALSPQLLSLLEEQGPPAAAAAAAGQQKQSSWRAGAHALYLLWLQNPNLLRRTQQQLAEAAAARQPQPPATPPPLPVSKPLPQPAAAPKKKSGGLFACFGCGGADADEALDAAAQQRQVQLQQQQQYEQQQQQQIAAPPKPVLLPLRSEGELKKLAAGFSSFKNLPLSSSHLYWQMLMPRDTTPAGDASGTAEGAEVELFAAAPAAAAAAAGNGQSKVYADAGRQSDQGLVTGDYEVVMGSSPALLW